MTRHATWQYTHDRKVNLEVAVRSDAVMIHANQLRERPQRVAGREEPVIVRLDRNVDTRGVPVRSCGVRWVAGAGAGGAPAAGGGGPDRALRTFLGVAALGPAPADGRGGGGGGVGRPAAVERDGAFRAGKVLDKRADLVAEGAAAAVEPDFSQGAERSPELLDLAELYGLVLSLRDRRLAGQRGRLGLRVVARGTA